MKILLAILVIVYILFDVYCCFHNFILEDDILPFKGDWHRILYFFGIGFMGGFSFALTGFFLKHTPTRIEFAILMLITICCICATLHFFGILGHLDLGIGDSRSQPSFVERYGMILFLIVPFIANLMLVTECCRMGLKLTDCKRL